MKFEFFKPKAESAVEQVVSEEVFGKIVEPEGVNLDNAENLLINLQMEMNTHGSLSEDSEQERRTMVKELEELQRALPEQADGIGVMIANLNEVNLRKAA